MRNAHLQERAEKYRAIYSGGDIADESSGDQVSGSPGDSLPGFGEARGLSHADSDDSNDPIIAEYDVFVNNHVKGYLHLLQYVNRDSNQPYSEAGNAKPLEVRFKPKAGLVEADIPLNVHSNYDREKGIHWGEAMRKSRLEKGGDSYGLAGGFGIGSSSGGRASGAGITAKAGGRPNGGEDISQEVLLANFDDAINKGRVLDKQTLGGITNSKDAIQPNYYIGVFRNSQLHLNPLSSITQLRPQFHHIDASADQEKSATRVQRDATNPPRQQEARAVQMTVKSPDGDDLETSEIGKTLRSAQEEGWIHYKYFDENSHESWAAYERLFLPDAMRATKLCSTWTNEEWLDAMSAPRFDHSTANKKPPIQKNEPEIVEERMETSDDAAALKSKNKGKQKA
ncbi:hypothetical protein FGG08_000136 [Glutinoglossum americanum]|uniref:Uncharacterized protein n=1 Tax=Glutinoglossum americanum TaxID=1670608 RepID=A0A9P8IIG1_9PEZI|nr:hypothetical protein FGG08_000136 [Glutinoglossum americanum]